MPLGDDVPPAFNEEFGAWIRIEPASRSASLARGIEARTADPLWMLARQWQTGELRGEDAGSPIRAELTCSTQRIAAVRLGGGAPLAPAAMPLETLIEAEPWPADWRMRIRIGQQFERLVRTELGASAAEPIRQVRSQCPVVLPPDDELSQMENASRRFVTFMAPRAIDGAILLERYEGGTLQTPGGMSDSALTRVMDLLRRWLTTLVFEAGRTAAPAWRNSQLAYRFELNPPDPTSVASSGSQPVHLVAAEYRRGSLDWYSFDAGASVWPPAADMACERSTCAVYPARIGIGGTSPRWWAFEDAATDFGALDVATADLTKLLLMEFVLVYGDDWFSVPLTATMGGLIRVDTLCVYNVFGDASPIQPISAAAAASGEPWEIFGLAPSPLVTGARPLEGALLLLPVCAAREESRALEEVFLLRDEGANRVWAVEHTVRDGLGRPVDGFDVQRAAQERRRSELHATVAQLERELAAGGLTEGDREAVESSLEDARTELAALMPRPARGAALRYQLASTVPENWIPFNPVQAQQLLGTSSAGIRLRRARMLRNSRDEEPLPIPARTRFLSLAGPDPLLWIAEESVPRAGLHLQLTAQRARWTDGKTYVWLGRKALVGRGEGASGLRFDILDEDR